MTDKTPKRPRDVNQWAKRMVDLATMDEAELAALKEKRKREAPPGKHQPQTPGKRGSSDK